LEGVDRFGTSIFDIFEITILLSSYSSISGFLRIAFFEVGIVEPISMVSGQRALVRQRH
jgi:hypothetical protein